MTVGVEGNTEGKIAQPYDELPTEVNTFSSDRARHHPRALHSHDRAKLLYCIKGLINCQIGKCLWVVPENCAVWIPAGAPHCEIGDTALAWCAVFVHGRIADSLSATAFVIQPSVLLRELIVKSASLEQRYAQDTAESRMFGVLLDQIAVASRMHLVLPIPSDPRLQPMVQRLVANPGERTAHAEWAELLGMSERSFSRLVMREMGMTLVRWRHQLHISIAIPRLRSGESVQKVAHDLGYENSSSFITMFKKIMRVPPSRFGAITRNLPPP